MDKKTYWETPIALPFSCPFFYCRRFPKFQKTGNDSNQLLFRFFWFCGRFPRILLICQSSNLSNGTPKMSPLKALWERSDQRTFWSGAIELHLVVSKKNLCDQRGPFYKLAKFANTNTLLGSFSCVGYLGGRKHQCTALQCKNSLFLSVSFSSLFPNRPSSLYISLPSLSLSKYHVLGGAATCSKGFAICFLKVALSCLGSMEAAVQPNGLGNSQKTFCKTFWTSCRPRLYWNRS